MSIEAKLIIESFIIFILGLGMVILGSIVVFLNNKCIKLTKENTRLKYTEVLKELHDKYSNNNKNNIDFDFDLSLDNFPDDNKMFLSQKAQDAYNNRLNITKEELINKLDLKDKKPHDKNE